MKDVFSIQNAVTVKEAIKLLNGQHLLYPPVEAISIDNAYGRILSEDVVSSEDLPGFNRSTMDGYAVNSADTFGASESIPVYLQIKGEVFMGKIPDFSLQKGEIALIPTGGMLPEGTDSVVMYEYTNRVDEEIVEVMKPVSPYENVILAGEDIRKGEVVLPKGQKLRPQDIGALAGIGILEVKVFKKPIVAIVSTGNEVVPPGNPLNVGEIRDINSYNLAGMISWSGGIPFKMGIFKDDFDTIRAVVKEALKESQMVLITGGSSVGTKDYTSRVINKLGPPGVIFHGVTIKPGKLLIGGIINGIPVFGLPGHPAAVTVCFENFVELVLKKLSGEIEKPYLPLRKTVNAYFSRNLSSPSGREDHVRVTLEQRDDGLWAIPILGKSGLIKTLVRADGVVVIPFNKNGVYEKELVEVRLFHE